MLIKTDFEVSEPIDSVWRFFEDIPRVAACLPGAELSENVGDDKYLGKVAIKMGPIKLQFAGSAQIKERNDAAKRIVVDAAGADEKGRGQASMLLTATLAPTAGGTNVNVSMNLQISGAAAQYGRGLISDVTKVLLGDFGTNLQNRLGAKARGLSPDQVASVRPASGLAIGLRATRMALKRVFGRFFLPYQPTTN